MEICRLDRIKTLGQIASGFAHELNQPLSAILNYAAGAIELINRGEDSMDRIASGVRAVAGEAKRAGKIIQWMRSFVRKQEPSPTPVDINALIREGVRLLDHELRQAKISTRLSLGSQSTVNADSVQIIQVLVNLIRNSIEAIQADAAAASELSISSSTQGDWVKVAVKDRGCGLPAEHLNELFNPFFTTKPTGMGLGLAICRDIIAGCGGELAGAMNPDGGMTFSFTLPAAASS
jgi:C4-dicarboxylate-specific signal transduction histidine kinase